MADLGVDAVTLAGLIYDAPGRPDGWDAFLDRLAETLSATGPGLYVNEARTDLTLLSATRQIDAQWGRRYEAHFAPLDLRRRAIRTLPADTVFLGPELVPDRELLRSEFYADFLRPQGFFHLLGSVALHSDEIIGVLRVIRSRTAAPFDEADRALLRQLTPHVRRSVAVHRQLALASARHAAATDVLDRFQIGVLLLDGRGHVRAANRRAEQLLDLHDGLRADRDGLRAASTADTAALRALIAGTASAVPTGGAIAVTRPSGRDPFAVLVAPLRAPALTGVAPGACAVAFITDPEQHTVLPRRRVQRHLGLTAAEADVALTLAGGHTVEEAARMLGISPHTARTQLKHALARTGARRQSALVRLVLAAPPLDDETVDAPVGWAAVDSRHIR
jgi:DNA-binding CsgD family transcriptional regulator/PAS domain-containing protein